MAKDAKAILETAWASATVTMPLVANCARAIAARWKRDADLKLDVSACTAGVIADNLQKIVEELVDNAFKFSEPGIPVRVISGAAGRKFSVSVINIGRGMTAEQIERIGPHIQFEREKYEQQGAGLGLIIAKRLTELNGGNFSMTSTPGEETKVTITFQPTAA
jgi:signal transduction histidine kinase